MRSDTKTVYDFFPKCATITVIKNDAIKARPNGAISALLRSSGFDTNGNSNPAQTECVNGNETLV